ncbi:hypothetical protein B5F14_06640 [Faecalitalea cylindroides]|uniref:BppU N-terminal domain-containing protein n=1 Tax=Faecalitalea cylindroides TaxID=39483 RepID=A0A1Y4LWS5_9FIRM|nr:hypothetical protein [Faecalitalea cylindroides]OUP60089.1 hypothetical protein B5F14_06640 [Faecalitalea cylindroides]
MNDIELIRGDTLILDLSITDMDGEAYELQPDDECLFTVKKNVYKKDPVIQKRITGSSFQIEPKDTESLSFGSYVYDVQLTLVSGEVHTIIPPSAFKVLEEVTW